MFLTNKQKFNLKYGQKRDQPNSKKDISKLTGIPMRILDAVYDRGLAAHKNNPESVRQLGTGKKIGGKSLKGKMSPQQWSISRVYSFVMKQAGTWGKADKDLADQVRKLKKKPKQKKGLTEAQEKRLKKHSDHHTKKHMDMMRRDMMNGMSFKMAHEKAMSKIGR